MLTVMLDFFNNNTHFARHFNTGKHGRKRHNVFLVLSFKQYVLQKMFCLNFASTHHSCFINQRICFIQKKKNVILIIEKEKENQLK